MSRPGGWLRVFTSAVALVVLGTGALYLGIELWNFASGRLGTPTLPNFLAEPLAEAYAEFRKTDVGNLVLSLNLLCAAMGLSNMLGVYWDFRKFLSVGRGLVRSNSILFHLLFWPMILLSLHFFISAVAVRFGFHDAYAKGFEDIADFFARLWALVPKPPPPRPKIEIIR